MKIKEDILNELTGISQTVATVPFVNVFRVDAAYFAGIETELKAKLLADTLYGSNNNFDIPAGYFENLSNAVLLKIKLTENEVFAELHQHSPLIAAIGNKNIFSAPLNYFEGLAFINEEKTAKVIQIKSTRGIFKYAAAAVITGLLGLSIINIVSKDKPVTTSQITNQTTAVMNTADTILKIGTFDAELAAVSDKDIEHYLQQGGQDVDAALVASSTDEIDKLPDAAEYLLDENALANYLKNNNLKN